MESIHIAIALATLVFVYFLPGICKTWTDRKVLSNIPTVGKSGILSSYLDAYRFIFNARNIIQEGYTKYRGAAFKVPTVTGWVVVVSGQQMVDDIRKASKDQLSFREAALESMQTKYTIGPEVRANGYHVAVVKSSLNRNLDERFTDVQDELVSSFQEYVPLTQDWTEIGVLPMIRKVISRASNRLFVGLPVCRNPDYRDLNVEFTVDLLKAAQTINLFPNFLKPLIGRYVTNSDSQIQRALLHLRPIIEERLKKEDEFGKDWLGKPASDNDALTWLLEYAEEKQRTVRDLTLRILTINFAAIHTTSMTFAQVLYDIAANPSFVPALREEIEIITAQDGFSKSSLNKMIKLDSFIKESQRLGGISALSMTRKVMNDFTFSDGTVVPRGHTIAVATYATHLDEDSYENPLEFDGFRFSKMRELQDDAFNKHQMVSLSLDYVVFGIGKQACPGRFFAVHELKVLLAHVLLNYDVAFANNGPRPANSMVAHQVMMDPQAVVMFRKRQSGAV